MLWIFLSVLLWGFFHSFLASMKAKDMAQRWLGLHSVRVYRLVYNLFALLSFLPTLLLMIWIPDAELYVIRFPWAWLFIVGEVVALVVLVIGSLQSDPLGMLGLRQSATSFSQSYTLVTTGLYRYMRHPLYTAGLVFIWLLPIITVNTLAINLAITVYVIVGTFVEERKLRAIHGLAYEEYMRSTPMFIPGLRFSRNKKK